MCLKTLEISKIRTFLAKIRTFLAKLRTFFSKTKDVFTKNNKHSIPIPCFSFNPVFSCDFLKEMVRTVTEDSKVWSYQTALCSWSRGRRCHMRGGGRGMEEVQNSIVHNIYNHVWCILYVSCNLKNVHFIGCSL